MRAAETGRRAGEQLNEDGVRGKRDQAACVSAYAAVRALDNSPLSAAAAASYGANCWTP